MGNIIYFSSSAIQLKNACINISKSLFNVRFIRIRHIGLDGACRAIKLLGALVHGRGANVGWCKWGLPCL